MAPPFFLYWRRIMSNNIVQQEVEVDKHGNWSLTNVWDAEPVLRSCYEDKKKDPYLGKHKGGRRLGRIPYELWNDPTQLTLQCAKEAIACGDHQSFDKYIRQWLKDNPEYMTVEHM